MQLNPNIGSKFIMSDAQDKNGSNDHTIADAHSGSPSDTKPNLASFVPKQSLQPVIKAVDMDQDMQNKVIELATQSLEQFSLERDVAEFLKRQFDSLYGSTWHCVSVAASGT